MGNLVPNPQWVDVPYFEANAVLTGGPDCPDNLPIKALLDRTEYLKSSPELSAPTVLTQPPGDNSKKAANTEFVVASQGAHSAAADPHTQYVKKAGDTMTGPLVLKQGLPGIGGLAFSEPVNDTGVFSTSDGVLKLFSNGQAAIEVGSGTDTVFRINGSEVLRLSSRGVPAANDRVQLLNGFVLQFLGLTLPAGVAAGTTQIVPFNWPVAFPNACLTAFGGMTGGIFGYYNNFSVEQWTKNGGVAMRVCGQTTPLGSAAIFGIGY